MPRSFRSQAFIFLLTLSVRVLAAEPATEARQLYAEGKAEYAQAHYERALELFERSYALSESPALLFNMAQAHRLAGPDHCAAALSLYQSYLAASPDADNRKEVEERISELSGCARAKEKSPSSPPVVVTTPRASGPLAPTTAARHGRARQTSPPAQRRHSNLPSGAVLLSGAGAAVAVAGGVLYWRAWDKHREAERVCPCYPGTYSSWEVLTNVSYALLALGGTTLAGGVTWWVVASGRDTATATPAQAMLGVRGRF